MSAREKWGIPHRAPLAGTEDLAAHRIRELLLALFQGPNERGGPGQGTPEPAEPEGRPEGMNRDAGLDG